MMRIETCVSDFNSSYYFMANTFNTLHRLKIPIDASNLTVKKDRPKLPDFTSPPLHEVVLGVQFSQPLGYQQIRAGEVWNLYRDQYPVVQEQQALQPTFETFGLPHQHPSLIPRFGLITGGTHDRFWFLNKAGDQLVQFQQDRLLHNWRKVGGGTNEYPRFEAMAESFLSELIKLQTYMNSLEPQMLAINQCEITYINHIKIDHVRNGAFSAWLNFLHFPDKSPDDFSMTFREVIKDEQTRPLGRLYVESGLGYLQDGTEVIQLSMTVKGAPNETNVDSAMAFLNLGRKTIVERFVELTTDEAHVAWGRIQ